MKDNSPIFKHIPLSEDFNNWWYVGRKQILKYILTNQNISKELTILEIGPGVGVNIKILQEFGNVDILEVDEYFVDIINKNNKLKVNSVYDSFSKITKKYDLVVFMDVLEHIEHYDKFLNDVANIMTDNAVGVMSVPAYQSLFSKHDQNLRHFRRYSWRLIEDQLKNRFTIQNKIGYNFLLLPIRFLQIKLNYGVNSTKNHGKFTDSVLYAISVVEHFFRRIRINPKFGISIYATLKKRAINA